MSYPSASEILASACAGMLGRIVAHPLDTVKSKLQAATDTKLRHPLIRTIANTYRAEGFRGFYKGLGACLVGGIPGVVVYLTSYEASRKYLGSLTMFDGSSFSVSFLSGMIAEASSCIIFVPVDVIKERLQVQQQLGLEQQRLGYYYQGSWDAAKQIARHEGLRGIYKGYLATLAAYGPFSAFYFLFYEELKSRIHMRDDAHVQKGKGNNSLPFNWSLLASASAGAAASLITNPLDMIKLRLQIQRSVEAAAIGQINSPSSSSSTSSVSTSAASSIGGLWDGLSKVFQKDGIQGLFRGALARVLFHAPSTAITMASYEVCKTYFSQSS
jgi:hypothetical protein